MKMNRKPADWAVVSPDAVVAGSTAQARNVLEMALQDIAQMAREIEGLRKALGHIRDGYERGDISHVEYRVGSYKAALLALAVESDGGVEASRHAAPMASVPAGVTSGSDGVAAIPSVPVIRYIEQFGGRCRDCADHDRVCPYRGLPCGDGRSAIRHVLTALYYGTHHGFIREPDHLPHREELAEFLVLWVKRADAQDCADAILRIVRAAHPTKHRDFGGRLSTPEAGS